MVERSAPHKTSEKDVSSGPVSQSVLWTVAALLNHRVKQRAGGKTKCRTAVYVRVILIGCVQDCQQGGGSKDRQGTKNNFD